MRTLVSNYFFVTYKTRKCQIKRKTHLQVLSKTQVTVWTRLNLVSGHFQFRCVIEMQHFHHQGTNVVNVLSASGVGDAASSSSHECPKCLIDREATSMYLHLYLYKHGYRGNSHSSISAQCVTLTVRLSRAALSSRWQFATSSRPPAVSLEAAGWKASVTRGAQQSPDFSCFPWQFAPTETLVEASYQRTGDVTLTQYTNCWSPLWSSQTWMFVGLNHKDTRKDRVAITCLLQSAPNPKSNVPPAGAGRTGEDGRLLPQTKQHIHPSHWGISSASLTFCSGLWYAQNDLCWLVRASTSSFPVFHSKLKHLVNRKGGNRWDYSFK